MNAHIATPASCARRPTVAILGAGIAGLTAAHELAERGFEVTVYEPHADERAGLGDEPAQCFPPVKLGGLAASQYSTVGSRDGSEAELRPFPGRRGNPRPPGRAVAGEHGFRFFPAYYLHIWDLFQRIPIFERLDRPGGEFRWLPTSRTVMDNVRRVITQGMTVEGKPSLVFPREAPRSPAEFASVVRQLGDVGVTAGDVAMFVSRLLRFLVTSPLRRATELQQMSAYDFFVGRDRANGPTRFAYSPAFDRYLREMPRVLAAFDPQWGDAQTNLTTYLQLQLTMERRDNKADGVLNGPTTEAWLDHWYRHLVALGVRFVRGSAERLEPAPAHPATPPHRRPRVQVTLADGTRITPDYTVVAVDAPAAEKITTALRAAGAGGTIAGLDGFTTSVPPEAGPLQPADTRSGARRDPYRMDQMGRVPWDRFQTLAGIQYFFDTEFQLLRGHMYYSGSEWALSSINQHGLWEQRPNLGRDGHISVLSVDIGDFNTPSTVLMDEDGRGKTARDCTPDEIATEVWRQIAAALTQGTDRTPETVLPWPAWYALDRGLVMADGEGQGTGRPVRNQTPYLVPIVGDWPNRPGGNPWNPHGTSPVPRPSDEQWRDDLVRRDVWQAGHGGYQVHHNSVVFAGTWTKTFTRMTSMEAACESGRHAVNAILDHYLWVQTDGLDRRDDTSLHWRFPYGFLDQGHSSPVRMPTPAGDYCYIFDIENREPAETRLLRVLDTRLYRQSLPHPLDVPTGAPAPHPPREGVTMTTPPTGIDQQVLATLTAWRQFLEQWTTMASGLPLMAGAPAPPSPADYTQQLFGYLQAWRQYLEQTAGVLPSPGSPPQPPAETMDAQTPATGGRRRTEPDEWVGRFSAADKSAQSGPLEPPKVEHSSWNEFGNQIDWTRDPRREIRDIGAPLRGEPVTRGTPSPAVAMPRSAHTRTVSPAQVDAARIETPSLFSERTTRPRG
ncbi:FAD-dependent oxidoreductase [Mycobacterium sp. PS03-16]|uniref:FAD-dependent oxidoreductase n=1 Tax=Mycobacterium sp. PS03-16 TaxID=2559611 RepID=UPI001073C4A0|nr:FAD-dependent oxidoreductase [Mycobacterium sp. PS03-16]TFV58854.1 FAD-dependent oxidoreductase [Mycobacterium sp. PS03-16]